MGGPSGELYVLIEGAPRPSRGPTRSSAPSANGSPAPDSAELEAALQDEDESASAGMGLFFTE